MDSHVIKSILVYIWFVGSIIMIVYGAVNCNVKVRTHECPKNCYYEDCSHYEKYDDDAYVHKTSGYYIYGSCSCPQVNPDGTTVFICSNYETYSKTYAGYVTLLVVGIIMLLTSVAFCIKINVDEKNKIKYSRNNFHRKINVLNDEELTIASAPPMSTIYDTSPLHTLPLAEAI